MDASKLTPLDQISHVAYQHMPEADAAFFVRARKALEIRMKRGWFAVPSCGKYRAAMDLGGSDGRWNWVPFSSECVDPDEAIIAAESAYVANVEKEKPDA